MFDRVYYKRAIASSLLDSKLTYYLTQESQLYNQYRKTIHIVRENASTHRTLLHPNRGFRHSIQIQLEKNVDRL
ncbi:hypothetical protein H1P_4920005 [Hyella patelloides LEGE 07179]|uniref:Uncharacterized protein n=1 Tax=Hyella patelloides LEGE 07179 TaxID=945734 RepID=A0A563VZB6_9CYAN|nr:hypothetical protein H1P_4920005 [Hyella patelloides LEGE 07179]